MLTKLIVSMVFALATTQLSAQTDRPLRPNRTSQDTAAAELEAVVAEAGKLDDKLHLIHIRAKAAGLTALSDPIRSETMFSELWKFAKQQDEKEFDKERALTIILRYVVPRNPQLARQLLGSESKPNEISLESRVTGRDPSLRRTVRLASELAADNPRAASELIEQSLPNGVSPAGLNTLFQLREREPLLTDSVVARTIEALRTQPDVISLSGLQMLSAYAFPEGNSIEISSSLEALQAQYFSATLEVLRASLGHSETSLRERNYSQADLRFRSLYQARLSLTLAALAPRYRPDLAPELGGLASRLSVVLPDNVLQLSRMTTERLAGNQKIPDDPEQALAFAISNGDFEEAQGLVDKLKSEDLRERYAQLLIKLEAKSLLAKSDVIAALTRIRKLEDQNARLILYIEAVKIAQKKRDAEVRNVVINEARLLIPQVERNGLHVRTLLTFASQVSGPASIDEAVGFLEAAVVAMNSLPKRSDRPSASRSALELAHEELNDPSSLLDEPDMERAFVAVGLLDLDLGLTQAKKIQPKPVQLMARLQTIQGVLKQAASKPKPAAPRTKVAPRVDSSKP